MNVRGIIENFLKTNQFDGLFNESLECACEIGDLVPCESDPLDCEPGWKEPCDCPEEHQWHITNQRKVEGD